MKGRKHRGTGGSGTGGTDDFKEEKKPEDRTADDKVGKEAEEDGEMKKGGRAKKKRGGSMHKDMKVEGEKKHHMGRMPRKAGGRTGSDSAPFSSARHGTEPAGRTVMPESKG
jgi:hypothetical protein